MAQKQSNLKVLVIDDDPNVSWMLSKGLSDTYDFKSARDGIEGIQMVTTEEPDLILLDIKMPGMSGLEVLDKLNKVERRPDVLMLSGHAETEMIVEAMKRGASEFIKKPFEVEEVGIHLDAALERRKLKNQVKGLKAELKASRQEDMFVGESDSILKIKELVEQVANSELTVLIRGESGTGKEIVARALHTKSERAKKPFVKVNCAAIPRDLLEAELFGYERGAFTGAHKTKQGRFEVADKGTIFLDEIGDMPLELQSKLLQVLEQQEFVRIGGLTNIHVDVRIVCATNRDLEEAIVRKEFRDDLFYRLNEITLRLPPLRTRKSDIPLLINYFVNRYNEMYQKSLPDLSHAAIEKLINYSWPGNIRQLENLVKQAVVRNDETIIDELLSGPESQLAKLVAGGADKMSGTDLAGPFNPETDGYSLKKRVDVVVSAEEKRLIKGALTKTNWNRRRASELLEISYRSLLYKIKEYELNSSS
ncbi:MAG: sigma-54-dependent Fis family transcriptional regulator [candidate division Zixibacteria bacterium]|nr:sigma-54-dependent Fis family transcriptional regulator [candidate division Zixibacteria bacterium]